MEKMTRKQTNQHWPAVLEAEIVTVPGKNFGDHSQYRLSGLGADAKALCPKKSYGTKAALIAAAKKLGWE